MPWGVGALSVARMWPGAVIAKNMQIHFAISLN